MAGRRRRGQEAQGRTLPAAERPWHKAYAGTGPVPRRTARKQEVARRQQVARRREQEPAGGDRAAGASGPADAELVVGRNPVVEALRAGIPATAIYLAYGIDRDDRVQEITRTAADREVPLRETTRDELTRLAGGVPHQGVGLRVRPYAYQDFDELVAAAARDGSVLVALDGVTDPRNLGAVVRSVAAFGGAGVVLPRRRAASMTAAAWRASAGAAARVPVVRVTNLTRALIACQQAGLLVAGLTADADADLYDPGVDLTDGPLVLAVGSEGRGLSRLVARTCDLRLAIPIASDVESLNASVAAAVALAEVSRQRRDLTSTAVAEQRRPSP